MQREPAPIEPDARAVAGLRERLAELAETVPESDPSNDAIRERAGAVLQTLSESPVDAHMQRVVGSVPASWEAELRSVVRQLSDRFEVIGELRSRLLRMAGQLEDVVESIESSVPDHACSSDGCSLFWYGESYTFNRTQALVVRMLYDRFERRIPAVSRDTLAEEVGDNEMQMRNVFRDHPAWGTAVVQVQRGVYSLNLASQGGPSSWGAPTSSP